MTADAGRLRAAFVYPNSRAGLAADVAAGRAPDTALLGQNHLAELGVDARIHEPRVHRRDRAPGAVHRVLWNLRELALPLGLRRDDVAVTPLVNLFPLAARAARRPRVVVFDWGLGAAFARASGPRRRLLAAAVRSAAAVLSPSEAQRVDAIERFGLDERRVHTVELGVDERFFRPGDARTDEFVLAVGKDLARDYGTLVAAAARAGVRTVVVAHPRNVAGLELPSSVEVRHGLGWDELRELYARAACVALPLRSGTSAVGTDGSGLTAVLEAMASGKAVVATRRPALETYLDEGRTGLFVDAERPDELAEALSSLVSDRELAQALGAAARRRVEDHLTTRALAGRLAPVLTSVAGRD
jgi:glycosyltransferase involved in cell wall biosynthesis